MGSIVYGDGGHIGRQQNGRLEAACTSETNADERSVAGRTGSRKFRVTQERRYLAEYSGNVIGMDEEYIYLSRKDSDGDAGYCIVYEKIRIEDGEKIILFLQDGFSDIYMIRNITDSCGMSQISGDTIYYVEETDYRLYLARRSLDDPSDREMLGDAFFDSGISGAGRVEK